MQKYSEQFMVYADESSASAATTITKIMRGALPIQSVLDIGCAKGTWLKAWHESGAKTILGIDGNYVSIDGLVIPREMFKPLDIAVVFELEQKFDLVQSLEVAEHIEAKNVDAYISNLARHSNGYILFSGAPPGQGGEFHVNEQPYDYWREKFKLHDHYPYDYVRPLISKNSDISYWYRYNIILYVRSDRIASLPFEISKTKIPQSANIPDVSPLIFRIRKSVVNAMPKALQNWLARVKANRFPSGRF